MKFSNASRRGIAILAMLVGFNLAGCGGGGGGDDDDSSGNNGGNGTPAPETIGGNNVTFYSGAAGTRTLAFQEDNSTWSEDRDEGTVTGTYRYKRVSNGSTGELVLNDQGAESTLLMTFNSQTTGSFLFSGAGGEGGSFEMQSTRPDPGGGNEPPPNDGLAPSSLAGRTMFGTRTYTSTGPVGQTHVYTFSSNTFHDSDPPEESDGTFIYEPSGDGAKLTLNYHSPAGFNGDKHELNMTFHTEAAGNFESIYTRKDGTVIVINGSFRLE